MSLDSLLEKVQKIVDTYEDPSKRKKREQEEAELDEFGRLKKQIARDIKETRKQIEERNELLGKHGNNAATAKISGAIRSKLKEIIQSTEELKRIQQEDLQKLEKKKSKGKEVPDTEMRESQYRAEIVELCFKHIEECKNMERAGFGNDNAFFQGYTKQDEKVVSQLPDIDDADFKLLKQNDQKIDEKLKKVGEGVEYLKNMAVDMGREIEMQGVMINDLDKKMDETQAQLNNLNRRLKNTLQKVRSADRFCIDIILLIIILAIGGYIYNVVRNSN